VSVYFIRAGKNGPVKIGTSRDVKKRLKSLQTSHHEDLTIIRVINSAVEWHAHQVFAAFRLKREWFKYDPSMLTWQPRRESQVYQLRRSLFLTQEQMAKRLGVHQSMIARYEAGRVPSKPVLKLLEMLNG